MQPSCSVFSQITKTLFPAEFARCVRLFPGRRKPRGISEYDQFLALCFGQLTYRESLRDIVACLQAKGSQLYHLGFRGNISRTNLAYANKHRDWRVFCAVAQILMRRAGRLYQAQPDDPESGQLVFALDSSIIRLSLSLFPWGYYARNRQAAVKLHLMLGLQGNLPAWAAITEADFPDMKALDSIAPLPGAFYVMDRGYLDFTRLSRLHHADAFFLVRNKAHVKFRVLASRPVDKSQGIRCDQTIKLTGRSRKCFDRLRRISIHDSENRTRLVLLSNQFQLPPEQMAQLYRQRWQVELFFKWIKQHLRLRAFYGRSENAVRTQVWSAISAHLMVAIVKKRLQTQKSLNQILQIVSVQIFEQRPLAELLTEPDLESTAEEANCDSQKWLEFNDF